ncbi:MAG: hypothetical protein K2M68_08320 [Muribaculaceae bacterium]|nr:hypothetical protein [Muribaculaceae bacterium]
MLKFKSLITVVLSLLTLSACGPTKEEKAEEMASNYLKGVLFHFDSYEPLQTKVDSSFVSLASDKEAIDLALDMLKLFQSAQEYANKIKRAERTMDICYPNSYSTEYSKGEYRRAKEERDNYQQLLDKTRERILNQFSKIKSRQSYLETEANLKMGNFDGWEVYHKFKSLNGAETVDLMGEYIFICDTNFNEKFAFSKNDYEAIKKVMTAISESSELQDLGENLQDNFLTN